MKHRPPPHPPRFATGHGKFFLHQPTQAQVRVERQGERIVVEVEDFISPTIVERLEMDTPLFKVNIPDWRAMVDVIMIDSAYDGALFNILSPALQTKEVTGGGHLFCERTSWGKRSGVNCDITLEQVRS